MKLRLAAAVCLGTIGGVGMWSVVVVLPAVQAEFGVTRGAASLPYTLTMLGFGLLFLTLLLIRTRTEIRKRRLAALQAREMRA